MNNSEIDIHPHLFREYDLEAEKAIRINSVYKVDAPFGTFAVKKSEINEQQAVQMNDIIQCLRSYHFAVPAIIPNKYGEHFIQTNDGLVYTTKWLDGAPFTLNYQPHLLTAISAMGYMHQKGFIYVKEKPGNWYVDDMHNRQIWEERIRWLKKYQKKLRKKTNLSTFEKLYLSYIPFLKEWAEEAIEQLNQWMIQYESISEIRKTITHGRFHHRNTLITNSQKMYLLDFEHVSIDTPIKDLAYFIRHYILNKEHRMWAQQWLKLYENYVPLSVSEKKILGIYLLFPERMFTLAKNYEKKDKNIPDDIFVKKLSIRWGQMKEMIWFVDSQGWLHD